MTISVRSARAMDAGLAHDWGLAAGLAAGRVPASGVEAADWTVRGWAEIALGAVAADLPTALLGLDEAVRRTGIACAGPYAERLRILRRLGGELPAQYAWEPAGFRPGPGRDAGIVLSGPVRDAGEVLAMYCDELDAELIRRAGSRVERIELLPVWTTTADHLRWGEQYRATPPATRYTVVDAGVPESLVRRSWMRLPSQGAPSTVLLRPAGRQEATVRQRIRQGLHNGAHLDHLGALSGRDGAPGWCPSPIEFGAGLMTAEAYAMSVEIAASAQCAAAGRTTEARELYRGLVSRIGRVPGFKAWQASAVTESPALRLAAADRVDEFDTLPTLAGAYVVGPLQLIATGWRDPLIPQYLAHRMRGRWEQVCGRFDPAAALDERIKANLG